MSRFSFAQFNKYHRFHQTIMNHAVPVRLIGNREVLFSISAFSFRLMVEAGLIVAPGVILGDATSYQSGDGTYILQGRLIASVIGTVVILDAAPGLVINLPMH